MTPPVVEGVSGRPEDRGLSYAWLRVAETQGAADAKSDATDLWSDLDDAERTKWLGGSRSGRGAMLVRLGLGIGLAVIGILVLTVRGTAFEKAAAEQDHFFAYRAVPLPPWAAASWPAGAVARPGCRGPPRPGTRMAP